MISKSCLLLGVFCLYSAGCRHAANVGPPVEPLTAPNEIEPRLRRLESFAFQLEYSTDRPFELGAKFKGIRNAVANDRTTVVPGGSTGVLAEDSGREHWQGSWWRGSERNDFMVIGDGSVQYERVDGEWSREPRGNESRIFDHIEQVLRRGLEFEGEFGSSYRYSFQPRLPVLDPGGQKEIRGELELNRQTGLLQWVRCEELDGPARWSLNLSRFNRAGRVEVPFVPTQEILLAPFQPQGRREFGHSVSTVEARLEKLGRRYRLFRRRGQLVLQLERQEPGTVIVPLIGPGAVRLWAVERVELDEAVEPGGKLYEVGDDASRLVRLVGSLGGNGDFRVDAALEFIARPTLVFSEKDAPGAARLPDSGQVALMFNGRVLDITRADRENLDFIGIDNRDFVAVLAALAELPETAGLKAVEVRDLSR